MKTKHLLLTLLVGIGGIFTANAQYCSATSNYGTGGCSYIYMSNVTFNTLNNSTGCPSGPHYTNYAPTGTQTTTVYIGSSYTLSASLGYYAACGVWIDWNNDQTFATSEYTYLGAAYYGGTVSQSITVPSNASCGPIRMRLRTEYDYYGMSSGYACTTLNYGETEDYTITVLQNSPCSGSLASANATTSSSSVCSGVAFTLGLSTNYCNTGMTYQWQSSPNNSTWTNISGATTASYGASQTAATYYRCVITCTNNSATVTSASVQVTMNNFLSCYCDANSNYGTSGGYYGVISYVGFNQLANSSSYPSSSPYYTNYAATGTATTVVFTSQSYTLSASAGNYCHAGAWIDWNQNGQFETTEYYYIGINSGFGTTTMSTTVAVPTTALTGQTKMRIRSEYYGYSFGATMACGNTNYGEVEDYTITVVPTPQNDAGIQSIISPGTPTCDFDSVDITVALNNWGTDTLTSCTIKWQINTGSVNSYAYTGSVAGYGAGTDTVVIGNASFNSGDDLTIWTENPNGSVDSVALNDTATMSTISGLSGTYTIPGDYATLQAAANDLATYGVCGDVVMEIASGTYTQQVTFTATAGTSANATVTFRSAAGTYSAVTLQYAATSQTDNHVIRLNGADWYRFEDLTIKSTGSSFYGVLVKMIGGSDNNIVEDCWLKTNNYSYTGTGDYMSNVYINGVNNNNTIRGNRIEKGNSPVYAYGGSSSNRILGLTIEDNLIEDMIYYGPYFTFVKDLVFEGNHVMNDSSGYFGLYTYYPMYLNDINRFNIDDNRIDFSYNVATGYAVYMNACVGGSNPKSTFMNNCIVNGPASNSYGYYAVYMNGCGNMDVVNNSITRRGATNTAYRALLIANGGAVSLYNNSLADMNGGQALYIQGGFTVTNSDHNNIYSTGSNPIYWNVSNYASLAAYQAASGFDMNSVRTNPAYQDVANCITCNDTLNNAGLPWASNPNDLNDNVRSTNTPDIGATEYLTPSTFTLGPDTIYCASEMTIEAGPAQSISWLVNSTAYSTPNVTLTAGTAPTTFNISVNIVTEYCGSASDNAEITLVPNATLDSALHICAGASATLSPGGGSTATYNWSTGANTSTLVVDAAGSYSVTKDEMGCQSTATTVVTQSAAVDIFDVEECADNMPVTLDASIVDGSSYAWSGGTSLNTDTNSFNDAGTYSVTATDIHGCSSTDNFTISVLEEPVAVISETHSGVLYNFDGGNSLYLGSNPTYFWDLGYNGQTATTQTASIFYPWAGNNNTVSYTVTLTVTTDCGESITTMEVTPDPLAVAEIGNGNITLYPNPANDVVQFTLANAAADQGTIQVMDLAGRVVLSQALNSGTTNGSINVAELAQGSYMVKVTVNGVVSMNSLVKQ